MIDGYVYKQTAIDALAKAMPSLTTPDGYGEFDHDIQIADEAFVDSMQIIQGLPSADVVEVVRCKDCKYCDTGIDEDGNHFLKCLGWVYGGTKEDDYCSHGVRKDG